MRLLYGLSLLVLVAPASAQRPPQIVVGAGASPVDGSPSPSAAVTLMGWPGRVGFAVHGDYAQKYTWESEPSAASVGVLAALAVPAGGAEIVLAVGPSASRDGRRFEARGWRLGGMGRVAASVPVGGAFGLSLGAGVVASADGVRPSVVSGLSLRLGG